MYATPKKTIIYATSEGYCPFEEWLYGLRDLKAIAQIQRRIARVQLGNLGDAKSVGGGVSELRIMLGPGYRIYFAQEGNQLIILLCGGDKSSQTKDIKLAQEYLADILRRRKENG